MRSFLLTGTETITISIPIQLCIQDYFGLIKKYPREKDNGIGKNFLVFWS